MILSFLFLFLCLLSFLSLGNCHGLRRFRRFVRRLSLSDAATHVIYSTAAPGLYIRREQSATVWTSHLQPALGNWWVGGFGRRALTWSRSVAHLGSTAPAFFSKPSHPPRFCIDHLSRPYLSFLSLYIFVLTSPPTQTPTP